MVNWGNGHVLVDMGPIHDSTFRDFVNGSDQAFTKVYEELKLHMLDYTRLRGLDRNQCEEAVAVTLLKVLEKRAKFHSLVHLNNFAAKCLEQSIQKLGRTLRQIPEDDFHESFENVMHLYYDGCSATDIAKLMNIERKIVDQYLKRGKRILGDRAGPGESDGPNQVAIGFHNGLLEVTPLRPDGSFVLSDDLYQTAAGIYVFGRSKWEPILRELSGLINKAGLKERELQDFFESYPELLLNDEYCRLIPQATIVKDDHCHWKADFVLVPYDQLSFAKILELKLPSAPISRSPAAGHHQRHRQRPTLSHRHHRRR